MTKDRVDIYLEERKLLVEAQRVSSQQFDKYVLTLSSGFLSLSITFLRYIFPQTAISHKETLVMSWILFCTAILSTLISFLTSQNAHRRQLQITEDYYVRQDENALNAKNSWSICTGILNYCSAIFFILAVAVTVYFVATNFLKP
jgi:hypothetical protein